MRQATAACALLLAACAALAQDTRAALEQRIKLTARLIADSPTAQRIIASGNPRAVNHLDESRVHQSLAEEALDRGDLAAARREVDDALRHIGQARRLAPDAPAQQAALRQRFEQMQASLDRLIAAWRGRLNPNDADDGDLVAALGLIGTARYFSEAARYDEAVHTLAAAEKHVLVGMRRVMDSREVDYTQRAATPAEELQLELQRHQALTDLVPLAVEELKPRGDAAVLIERYGETSRSLRTQALQLSQAGDVTSALARIRNAMLYLQRALAAAGVSMPQASGSPP